jgi:hypothetical protein
MKLVKAQVYIDDDFPKCLFVKFTNGRIGVAKLVNRWLNKDRMIYHYALLKKDGKRAGISEGRIAAAMEVQRDLVDIRYVSSQKKYAVKKNGVLIALMKAVMDLKKENPGIDVDRYCDDAILKILEAGYVPTGYDDIKHLLLKHMFAVKIEREKRNVPFDDVAYFLQDAYSEEINEEKEQ